jgi:hypothetical protein
VQTAQSVEPTARARAWTRVNGWWTPVVIGLFGAIGMAVRLLWPHPVGMANNGDAQRLMCQIGADAAAGPKPTAKWYFVRLHYDFQPRHTLCTQYPSTQYIPLKLTAWIHQHVLGLHGVIDMRETIAEYCVLVGVALAAMAWLLRSIKPLLRFVILGALFVVLAEATFADYAGSPYSETAAMYGLLLVAVAGSVAVTRQRGERVAFLVAWVGALLAIGAKNEMVPLLLPLGLLLGTRRFEIGRLRGRVGSRLVPALCLASLAATATWSLASGPSDLKQINAAQEVTMTIMPMVHDPGEVAVGLGLPRSFGRYSGTHWWSPHPIEDDPLFPRYQDRLTQANVGRYLAQHPVLAARVFSGGAGAYWSFRNTNIGTYPMNAGYTPESQECRVCVLQSVAHALKWSGFPGVLATWLASLIAAAWLVRTSSPGTRRRAFALVALTLLGCTIVLYIASVYGEGNEVTKHLSVALFAAALTPLWLLAAATQARTRKQTQSHGADTTLDSDSDSHRVPKPRWPGGSRSRAPQSI